LLLTRRWSSYHRLVHWFSLKWEDIHLQVLLQVMPVQGRALLQTCSLQVQMHSLQVYPQKRLQSLMTMVVTPVDNWYFNIASVFVLTFVGGLLTSKLVEPR